MASAPTSVLCFCFSASPLSNSHYVSPGGSIRKPSTYCGLYGLRPTTRRLPYQGVSNVLHGFEAIESVIGPIARSVNTLKIVTKALIGAEPWFYDSRVIEKPWLISNKKESLRIAFMFSDGVVHNHPPVQRGLEETAAALRKAGHQVIEWSNFDHALVQRLFGELATADGGEDLRSFLAASGEPLIAETFSTLSSQTKSVYETCQLVVQRDEFRQLVLEKCRNERDGPIDLIICPNAPHLATKPLGSPRPAPLISWTTIWSLADLPVCTLPLGNLDLDKDGARPLSTPAFSAFDQQHWSSYDPNIYINAPIVLQLVNPKRHDEETLLAMVEIVEYAVRSSGL